MKHYTLERKILIQKPLDEVFSFFHKPENLSRITPPSMAFQILSPSPVAMKKGALIDYRIRIVGIPLRWTSVISEYHPPKLFIDEQLRGPYAFWKHTHFFREAGGETEVRDQVIYALPLGALGRIARRLWVKRTLENLFDYREKQIQHIFSK